MGFKFWGRKKSSDQIYYNKYAHAFSERLLCVPQSFSRTTTTSNSSFSISNAGSLDFFDESSSLSLSNHHTTYPNRTTTTPFGLSIVGPGTITHKDAFPAYTKRDYAILYQLAIQNKLQEQGLLHPSWSNAPLVPVRRANTGYRMLIDEERNMKQRKVPENKGRNLKKERKYRKYDDEDAIGLLKNVQMYVDEKEKGYINSRRK